MRVVVQRVMEASVVVSGTAVASISKGLLLLLGITHTDTEEDILVGEKNKSTQDF